jgi:hypothetical protein
MPVYDLSSGHLFATYDARTIDQTDFLLARHLKRKYGGDVGLLPTETILLTAFDWASDQFQNILDGQLELRFYQTLFLLHEMSCSYTENHPGVSPIASLTSVEYATYRRVLKLALEHACELPLKHTSAFTFDYIDLIEPTLGRLLYLGYLAYFFSNCLTEERMVKGSWTFSFAESARFELTPSPSATLTRIQIHAYLNNYKTDAFDKECVNTFIRAANACLQIDYDKVLETIYVAHAYFKESGEKLILTKYCTYPTHLAKISGITYETADIFFRGLTLSRANKLSLKEAILRSDSISRYLYRPILIWNVNGEDLVLVGDDAFVQGIASLCFNAFGWRKYPSEWKNTCFTAYIQQMAAKSDKLVEEPIAQLFKGNEILFDQNVSSFKKWSSRNLSFRDQPGEIDFLFLYKHKIYVLECKNQMPRFDLNNFRHDFEYFSKSSDAHDAKLAKKTAFVLKNLKAVEEHFQVLQNDRDFHLPTSEVEGIYVLNTPTFTMFNNTHQVFGLPQFLKYITTGLLLDKIVETNHANK